MWIHTILIRRTSEYPTVTTLTKSRKRRNRWQDKRLRLLKKMQAMRDAKALKRLARGQREDPPKMVRWHPLELGVRDNRTGETAWVDFRSVRDAARRLSVVCRFYA